MAKSSSDSSTIDSKSGFCYETKIYHSLRPDAPLFSETDRVSISDYAFSLLRASFSHATDAAPAIIDVTTGRRIVYPEFINSVETLAGFLQQRIGLSKGDVAFVLSPNSVHVPILYYSLFSIGVVISPSNPTSTKPEISRQIHLSKPVIAFATSTTAHKIPNLRHQTILLDSTDFEAMMTTTDQLDKLFCERSPICNTDKCSQTIKNRDVDISQSDPATILYSSGTTGNVKGAVLTHHNWTSLLAGHQAVRTIRTSPLVTFCAVPFFHVYGFILCIRSIAFGESLVMMERFDARVMFKAIDEFKVTNVAVAPPVIVKMVKEEKLMDGFDLSSLEVVACGGAVLAKAAIEKFSERLPHVQLAQAYGLTESSGGITRTMGPKESKVLGAAGKLVSNYQAKIVDPKTGNGLPPMNAGELWIRGPQTMKGYIGDDEATRAVIDTNRWLKTGDLCYIDNEGFMFFVERIKEMIKYKGYQVAPAELEHLLLSHPDIVDAAVIPYPDEEAGQVPMAFVVRRSESSICESEVKDYISKQVSPYKKIRRVSFIKSIPKNAPGKILRKVLVALSLSMTTSKL